MSKSLPGKETRQCTLAYYNSVSFDSYQRFQLLKASRRTARKRFWSDRDKECYECPNCGASDTRFEVHHRDGNALNNHPMNLVAVCHNCHVMEHKRRNTVEALQDWKENAPVSAD